MCENGLNIGQLELSIAQNSEMLGLAQEWLEQLHHLADHGHQHEASAKLAQVTVTLGEARSKLDEAIAALGGGSADDVTVTLV